MSCHRDKYVSWHSSRIENYNRDLLKTLLTQLNTHDDACKMMKADKVVVFHSKYHAMPQEKAPDESVPHYHERAQGNFDTPSDEELKERFVKISKKTC